MKKRRIIVITSMLLGFILNLTSYGAAASPDPHDLLKKARAALGGEDKLNALKSLTASGILTSTAPNGTIRTGDLEINFLLPDKFSRAETSTMQSQEGEGHSITRTQVLNGNQFSSDMSGAAFQPMNRNTQDDDSRRKNFQEEFARYLLAWTLNPPPTFPLQFTYAGQSKVEDATADVIDCKGPNNFSVKIFLDSKTHLPLLLGYKGIPSSGGGQIVYAEGMGKKPGQESTAPPPPPADMPHLAVPQVKDLELHLSDYKTVDGMQLPNVVKITSEGKVIQKWNVKRYIVNPPLTPDIFGNNQ